MSDLVFIVLLKCHREELINKEQKYIDLLNPYFNVCKIANSTLGITGQIPWNKGKIMNEEIRLKLSRSHFGLKNNLGKRRSEESKMKQSLKMKGRRICPEFSEETRRKISEKLKNNKNFKGKTHSKETREILSRKTLGKKRTPEQIERIRLGAIGKKLSENTKLKMSKAKMGHKNYYYGKKGKVDSGS